ncbi:Crp/Fnr family transcriptional regulator [Brevundimonas sp. UBA7534]|uniref:Crp/Fnr family transcriptional regulator n=1 Tax=Brevundimonas sp. UBA7534 TaxID=1946138 RepID=UPI0025BE0184|nr:Crp/Fnr family transcriptional regulator [Brevundimonas sp. UBA7534]
MTNLWLAALSASDRARLAPALETRAFDHGQVLFGEGQDVDAVWFPTAGVISLMTLLDDDKRVETAVIGREGVVGVTCGPLNGRAASQAVALLPGEAACCPADAFSAAMDDSESLRLALARFTEALMAQVQQVAACNARHALDERLARWLLSLHDRAGEARFDLTQADIAGMLGVRRATVSEVGASLEDRGLIERGRGWVRVLDRSGLKTAACGCYGQMRAVMDELDLSAPKAA